MPRYFFNTDDGETRLQDGEGMDLPDVQAARAIAMSSLPDMARDKLPNGDRFTFSVQVCNGMGTLLYSATLEFAGQWHVPPGGA